MTRPTPAKKSRLRIARPTQLPASSSGPNAASTACDEQCDPTDRDTDREQQLGAPPVPPQGLAHLGALNSLARGRARPPRLGGGDRRGPGPPRPAGPRPAGHRSAVRRAVDTRIVGRLHLRPLRHQLLRRAAVPLGLGLELLERHHGHSELQRHGAESLPKPRRCARVKREHHGLGPLGAQALLIDLGVNLQADGAEDAVVAETVLQRQVGHVPGVEAAPAGRVWSGVVTYPALRLIRPESPAVRAGPRREAMASERPRPEPDDVAVVLGFWLWGVGLHSACGLNGPGVHSNEPPPLTSRRAPHGGRVGTPRLAAGTEYGARR